MVIKAQKVHNEINSTQDNTVYDANIETPSGHKITRVVYDGSFQDEAYIRFRDNEDTVRRTLIHCSHDSTGFDNKNKEYTHTPTIKESVDRFDHMSREVIKTVVGEKLYPAGSEFNGSPMVLMF